MKKLIKKWVKSLPFAFTKNQKYDRQTQKVIQQVCQPGTGFIDVGCHKGEVLDLVLRQSPTGQHYGFEPIPDMFAALKVKYQHLSNCTIADVALSNENGTATFNYVVSNPSYSGLRKRKYDRPEEQDTTITVRTQRLDDFLPKDYQPALIKIDVEGAELFVLEGAVETLRRTRPIVIFEHGLGASEFYNATPEQIYQLFEYCEMRISLMDRWLKGEPALSQAELAAQFHQKLNYYFIAYPA